MNRKQLPLDSCTSLRQPGSPGWTGLVWGSALCYTSVQDELPLRQSVCRIFLTAGILNLKKKKVKEMLHCWYVSSVIIPTHETKVLFICKRIGSSTGADLMFAAHYGNSSYFRNPKSCLSQGVFIFFPQKQAKSSLQNWHPECSRSQLQPWGYKSCCSCSKVNYFKAFQLQKSYGNLRTEETEPQVIAQEARCFHA